MKNSSDLDLAADYCAHNKANQLRTLLENHTINPDELLPTFKYKITRTNVPLLGICVTSNSIDCAQLLLDAGANIEILVTPPIILAAKRGLVECVQLLLQAGAKPDTQDGSGRAPLHLACWHGHLSLIPLLLQHQADVNLKDFEENTPLHYACWNGNIEICKSLIKAGAKIDEKDQSGRTPLYFSVQHKHPDIVQFLLENNSDPSIQTCSGITPETLATQENIVEIIDIFQKFKKEHQKQSDDDGKKEVPHTIFGSDFTMEHNKMKQMVNRLAEERDGEFEMLKSFNNNMEEQNAAMSTIQSNIRETMNRIKAIETVLNDVICKFNTMTANSSNSANSNSTSSFEITRNNLPQMPASTNGAPLQIGSPLSAFTGLNNTSGSSIASNVNSGISPLFLFQSDGGKSEMNEQNVENRSSIPLCRMCKEKPATMRCKNCRSPLCNNCVQIVKQSYCPYCKAMSKLDK